MNAHARIDWRAALDRWSTLRVPVPLLARRIRRLCARREWQAAVMCAAGIALYFAAIRPERARLDAALHELAVLQPQRPVNIAQHGRAPNPLDQFYAQLPTQAAFLDALDGLLKTAAAHALSVNDGEYSVTREAAGKLVRYQIVLPLRGTYPQVRAFLAALAHDAPAMALENARFERRAIGEPTLDVKLRLVLFVVRTP